MPQPEKQSTSDRVGVGGFVVSERAKQLVNEVLDSNRLTSGPFMRRFESQAAELHDSKYALMCNSGTSALHVAVMALMETGGWNEGDEVLVPALTFVATSNVVIHSGLQPVFVDVEPDTYCIDPAAIESRITPRTRAVMPVHVAGQPCDMDPIMEIARRHDLRVIEDSAEAMFATYRGRPVGSFGDVGCFSTYAAHMITTGVGGFCTTSDDELVVILKSLMNHGRDSIYITMDDDKHARGKDLFAIADRRFSFVRLGHSFRATEMEAAVGVAQLEEREAICARRSTVTAALSEGLGDLSDRLQLPKTRPGAEHSLMFYPLAIIDPAVQRDDLILHLEDNGVETRYLLPLLNQPVYRSLFGDLDGEYPVAARLNDTAFYIGCHPEMTDSDVDHVVSTFHDFFRRA